VKNGLSFVDSHHIYLRCIIFIYGNRHQLSFSFFALYCFPQNPNNTVLLAPDVRKVFSTKHGINRKQGTELLVIFRIQQASSAVDLGLPV
jgi:hypothetical protein